MQWFACACGSCLRGQHCANEGTLGTGQGWIFSLRAIVTSEEEVGHSPGSQTVGRFARNPAARALGTDDGRVFRISPWLMLGRQCSRNAVMWGC